ncbi:MAG: hypothetical protein SVO01_07625 [Thermotogota bacterium]|nr:hypothetical protein [Thermotogota bacterium]
MDKTLLTIQFFAVLFYYRINFRAAVVLDKSVSDLCETENIYSMDDCKCKEKSSSVNLGKYNKNNLEALKLIIKYYKWGLKIVAILMVAIFVFTLLEVLGHNDTILAELIIALLSLLFTVVINGLYIRELNGVRSSYETGIKGTKKIDICELILNSYSRAHIEVKECWNILWLVDIPTLLSFVAFFSLSFLYINGNSDSSKYAYFSYGGLSLHFIFAAIIISIGYNLPEYRIINLSRRFLAKALNMSGGNQ